MTRISHGGSRQVVCPDCGAKIGAYCKDGGMRGIRAAVTRTQSHRGRIAKARALIEKRERGKRMTALETIGARRMRDQVDSTMLPGLPPVGQMDGASLAREVALAAINKLLRLRGAK